MEKEKGFFSRWRTGIKLVTPLEQIKGMLLGLYVTSVGLLCGVVVSILNKTWWLVIALIGGGVINYVQIRVYIQRRNMIEAYTSG